MCPGATLRLVAKETIGCRTGGSHHGLNLGIKTLREGDFIHARGSLTSIMFSAENLGMDLFWTSDELLLDKSSCSGALAATLCVVAVPCKTHKQKNVSMTVGNHGLLFWLCHLLGIPNSRHEIHQLVVALVIYPGLHQSGFHLLGPVLAIPQLWLL